MKALKLRVSELFMYCRSPNLPQTRKSSLKTTVVSLMGLISPSNWDNACSLRLALSAVGIQPEEGE